MDIPIWLFLCNPWRMFIYAVVLFGFDFAVVLGTTRLAGSKVSIGDTAKTVSWVYLVNIATQALGFGAMGAATVSASADVSAMLKAADYSAFYVFRIPLLAYLAGVVVMATVCRFALLRRSVKDPLERSVAAAVIGVLTSPWIIMLPFTV